MFKKTFFLFLLSFGTCCSWHGAFDSLWIRESLRYFNRANNKLTFVKSSDSTLDTTNILYDTLNDFTYFPGYLFFLSSGGNGGILTQSSDQLLFITTSTSGSQDSSASIGLYGENAVSNAGYLDLLAGASGVIRLRSDSTTGVIIDDDTVWIYDTTFIARTGHFRSGVYALRIGADNGAYTITDNTQKTGRMTLPHYDVDEEDVFLFRGSSDGADNVLNIGGLAGTNAQNLLSLFTIYTATDDVSLTGDKRFSIDGGTVSFHGSTVTGVPTAVNDSDAVSLMSLSDSLSTKMDTSYAHTDTIRVGDAGSEITEIKMIDDTNDTLEITVGGKTWQFLPIADQ